PMLPLLFSLSHNYTLLAYKPHYHKSISYLIWIIMRRAISIERDDVIQTLGWQRSSHGYRINPFTLTIKK
ncbi:MAG: hypothetical protein ACEY3M_19340, partial [Wolbachia sp.]